MRGAWKQLEPFTQGHYVNIMTSDADARTARIRAYGDNFPRLAAIKKRYDPNNLFHLNANIKAGRSARRGRAATLDTPAS